ncbi:class I SAM-dependent methyltransferase [Algihabitans albus]|uniref:class I SAM-dependent methyltransferase n=1 Tax=Algihabitans albus TaxID=2164067 RepID=UPI000E5D4910|nr:class I SAM-dependent methyltransferase [Algihabitans albus]
MTHATLVSSSPAELRDDGWRAHNIWQHSASVRALYTARARDEAEEMDCLAQAAELLAPLAAPGDSVIDAGCGSGYFFHSLRKRDLTLAYHGFDATAEFIEIGRRELAPFGLPSDCLQNLRLEDFQGSADHLLCINLLSNLDNYHRPLERLLKATRKSLILRESIKDGADYRYVQDAYLDPGVALSVHVNAYDRRDLIAFIEARGFSVIEVIDRRSGGRPENVIGYPHWWSFLVATRCGVPA